MRNKHEEIEYKDLSQAIKRINLRIAQSMINKKKEMIVYHDL